MKLNTRQGAGNKSISFMRQNMLIVVLVVFIVLLTLTTDKFLTSGNILNILRQISVKGIIALGMTAILLTGGIDLSAGAIVAFVTVMTGFVVRAGAGGGIEHIILAVLVGILAGVAAGLVNGCVIALLNVPPFIATLGMTTVMRGVSLIATKGNVIGGFMDGFSFIGKGYLFGIPFPIYILLLCAVLAAFVLRYTRFGKNCYALGGNLHAARVSGINVKKNLIGTYAFAGLLYGIAGIVLCSRLACGNPSAATSYELDAISSAVIGGVSLNGGVGSIGGTMLGAILLGVITNGMDLLKIDAYWQEVVQGLIIIVAVVIDVIKNKKK